MQLNGSFKLLSLAFAFTCAATLWCPLKSHAERFELFDDNGDPVASVDLSPRALYKECVSVIGWRHINPDRMAIANSWLNRGSAQIQTEAEATQLIKQMLASLGDPSAQLYINNRSRAGKIGILLTKRDGQILVNTVEKDSPAAVAGVHVGDVVQLVDNMPLPPQLEEAREMIKGETNTQVKLQVLRNGSPLIFRVTRSDRDANPESYFTMLGNLAYTRPSLPLTKPKFEAFKSALSSLEQARAAGLILDLRSTIAPVKPVDMCSLFIGQRPAVGLTENGTVFYISGSESAVTNLPMVLIVNRGTCEGVEQVAACLKHYHRARLVGERTDGVGVITDFIQLDRLHFVQFSHAECVGPDGSKIAGIGVQPDVLVAVDHKNTAVGPWWNYSVAGKAPSPLTGKDIQLQRAIEELTKMVAGASR